MKGNNKMKYKDVINAVNKGLSVYWSNTNYKIIMLALSAILIYFGITFLTDVIN